MTAKVPARVHVVCWDSHGRVPGRTLALRLRFSIRSPISRLCCPALVYHPSLQPAMWGSSLDSSLGRLEHV